MYTEGTDICSSLTANPEDTEVALVVEFQELELVDGTDTELTLDGRDQGRALEKRTSQSLHSTMKLLLRLDLVVQPQNADVFLSGALLRLDETGGTVDTNNQTTRDFGIECTTVTGLFAAQNALHPSDDFMRGRVGGLVEIDDTAGDVALDVALERRITAWDWCEVAGSDEKLVVVLEKQSATRKSEIATE